MSAGEAFISAFNSVSANRRMREQDARDEEDRAFQRGQRARLTKMQAEEDAYNADLKDASKPRAVESGEVYQPAVDDDGNTMPANPTAGTLKVGGQRFTDPAAAEQAANDANTPEAMNKRVMATMRGHGRLGEAAALETSQRQGKLADLQVTEAEAQAAARAYDRDLIKAVQSGGHQGLVQFIDDTKGDGAGGEIRGVLKPSADGKTVQYALVSNDGTERVLPYTFDNTPEGAQTAAFMLSRGVSPAEKLNHVRAIKKDADELADKDRNYKLREKEVDQRGELRAAQAELAVVRAGRMGTGGGGAGGAAGGPAPVWDDKADTFLRTRYTVTDPTTGQVSVDGAGLKFGKTVALAQARRNGGDVTAALGDAFELDNRIRQKAGGDPAKIQAERQRVLASLTQPAAAPATAPQAAAQPATPPAAAPRPRAPAAPMTPAAAAPMTPAAAAPQPAAQPQPARGDQVLAAMAAEKQQRVAQAQAALDAARQQLAAAGKSGDPQAITRYAQAVSQASAALDAAQR